MQRVQEEVQEIRAQQEPKVQRVQEGVRVPKELRARQVVETKAIKVLEVLEEVLELRGQRVLKVQRVLEEVLGLRVQRALKELQEEEVFLLMVALPMAFLLMEILLL